MFEKLLSANLSAALFPAVIVEALGHILHFAQTAREPTSALCVWINFVLPNLTKTLGWVGLAVRILRYKLELGLRVVYIFTLLQ